MLMDLNRKVGTTILRRPISLEIFILSLFNFKRNSPPTKDPQPLDDLGSIQFFTAPSPNNKIIPLCKFLKC